MGRLIAIDYGEKRVGIALSDPLKIIAKPYTVFTNDENLFKELEKVIKEKKVEKIIVGLPKNMDGSEGFQAQIIKEFVGNLNKITNIPHMYWDERLSSKEATKILHEQGLSEKEQKGIKDAYAAAVILKEYIQYGR